MARSVLLLLVVVVASAANSAWADAPLDADGLRSVLIRGLGRVPPPTLPLLATLPVAVESDAGAVVPASATEPVPPPGKLVIPPGGGAPRPAAGEAPKKDPARDPRTERDDRRRRRFSLR